MTQSDQLTVRIVGAYAQADRRISVEWTVKQLKERIETITGVPPAAQGLAVGQVPLLLPDNALVGSIGLEQNAQIVVSDTRPAEEQLNLDGEAEKYEMPIEEYEKRDDTVLHWKQNNHLGRFGETIVPTKADSNIRVGESCIVPQGTGSVAYVGAVRGIPEGIWVGVELDEPRGKHDGNLNGVQYFRTEPQHGVFVRPANVEITTKSISDDEL